VRILSKPPGKLFDLLANEELITWDIRDME